MLQSLLQVVSPKFDFPSTAPQPQVIGQPCHCFLWLHSGIQSYRLARQLVILVGSLVSLVAKQRRVVILVAR